MRGHGAAPRARIAPAGVGLGVLPLVRLLQLASPALPIGAYSYSQGLERVVEDGIVATPRARRRGSATS